MTVPVLCIDCGVVTSATRCRPCQQNRKRVRNRNTARARAVVAASPVCALCGATKDLTADHVQPLARGGSNAGPQRVLCRPCNSRLGGALAGNQPRGRQ